MADMHTTDAEFDAYADTYHDQHKSSIRLSGEEPDYFARYKIADVARALAPLDNEPPRILDFGGGIGNSLKHMRAFFPNSAITLLDTSKKSLEHAEQLYPDQAMFVHFDGSHIPFDDGAFDVVFVACVFHHIDHQYHAALIKELHRILAPGGSLFIFEHNPHNPLTRKAVRDCPFDENAVLLNPASTKSLVASSGFASNSLVYRIFFPRLFAALRPLERILTWLPLGAQYYVHATKNAA